MAHEICLDEEGDVILKVDRKDPFHLRVSSKNLMRASPVFAALLGPQFREGQAKRSSQDPLEVALPEDDGNAMSMICQQLHPGHKLPSGPAAKMDVATILDYAVLVDKYALVSFLRLQAEAILLSWLVNENNAIRGFDCFLKIIAASYLLEQKQAFKMATKHAMNMTCLAASRQHAHCWTLLPSSVVVVIAQRMALRYMGASFLPPGGLCLTCVQEHADMSIACKGHKEN
ncbi:uncharacterized protein MYCFIDRAFT_85006 [Pseudocercospora fijiensis CIRAD86]|uniref:BTB domain-containing protein n=1 Tax=Pseudocercospora fijiensis (strain CIRAD86) TaxID=383855 RepID=N1Q9S7_PSEFD|nr:uncharacterized protein MYCFIDRAFT_85006 [Pseudocercospora fijiensis CIRAD86]EME88561.1 hypothetical protein MYCFIDRAFT_85006 [Pseudocercospora fijiensis CIRAD86]